VIFVTKNVILLNSAFIKMLLLILKSHFATVPCRDAAITRLVVNKYRIFNCWFILKMLQPILNVNP